MYEVDQRFRVIAIAIDKKLQGSVFTKGRETRGDVFPTSLGTA